MESRVVSRDDFLKWWDSVPRDLVGFFMDAPMAMVSIISSTCWCCGGLRLVEHFITWQDGKIRDYKEVSCIEPYIQGPCEYALGGSGENECPFKSRPEAACTTPRGPSSLRPSEPP